MTKVDMSCRHTRTRAHTYTPEAMDIGILMAGINSSGQDRSWKYDDSGVALWLANKLFKLRITKKQCLNVNKNCFWALFRIQTHIHFNKGNNCIFFVVLLIYHPQIMADILLLASGLHSSSGWWVLRVLWRVLKLFNVHIVMTYTLGARFKKAGISIHYCLPTSKAEVFGTFI